MPKLTSQPKLNLRWSQVIDDHVISLDWSPDGSLLAVASVSGPVYLYDDTGKLLHRLEAHQFGTTVIRWSPNGKQLASAGQDGKIRFWDRKSASLATTLEGGAAWVEHLAWSPKGDLLVTAAGKKLRLWNSDGTPARSYPDYRSTVSGLAWFPKGKEFAVSGYGGVMILKTEEEETRDFAWLGSVIILAISPDGSMVAGGAQDASVHFWYTKTGDDLEMQGYPAKINTLSWDANSRFLATGGSDTAVVWDCSGKGPEGSTPIACEMHKDLLSTLEFQRRGQLLATACHAGQVGIWWPEGAKKVLSRADFGQGVSQLQWHPADARLAVGGESGQISMYAI